MVMCDHALWRVISIAKALGGLGRQIVIDCEPVAQPPSAVRALLSAQPEGGDVAGRAQTLCTRDRPITWVLQLFIVPTKQSAP